MLNAHRTSAPLGSSGLGREEPTSEDGNILLLAMGYVLIIVLAVMLTATLSGLHLERKRLIALADSAALVASDYVSGQEYLDTLNQSHAASQTTSVTMVVQNFLNDSHAGTDFDNLDLVAVAVTSDGSVTVELSSAKSILAAFDLSGRGAFAVQLRGIGTAVSLN